VLFYYAAAMMTEDHKHFQKGSKCKCHSSNIKHPLDIAQISTSHIVLELKGIYEHSIIKTDDQAK